MPTATSCRVETAAAEKSPGVVKVVVQNGPGKEIQWQGEILAVVAAESEGAAREAAKKIEVKYEQLAGVRRTTTISPLPRRPAARTRPAARCSSKTNRATTTTKTNSTSKEIDRLFKEAKHVVEGYYGIDVDHALLPGAARLDRQLGRQASSPRI